MEVVRLRSSLPCQWEMMTLSLWKPLMLSYLLEKDYFSRIPLEQAIFLRIISNISHQQTMASKTWRIRLKVERPPIHSYSIKIISSTKKLQTGVKGL
jgi:hypothetical protein